MARLAQSPKLRQRDVDELVSVPFGRTAHYENGRAAPPHGYLMTVAQAWEVPIGWFLDPDESAALPSNQASRRGMKPLLLKGALPRPDKLIEEPSQKFEVDEKFAIAGAFVINYDGPVISCRFKTGDFLVFWPCDGRPVGRLLYCETETESRLATPTYNFHTNKVELRAPGGEKELSIQIEVCAVMVGIIRTNKYKETSTLFNPEGIRVDLCDSE